MKSSQKIKIAQQASQKLDDALSTPLKFDERFILESVEKLKKGTSLNDMIALALLATGSRISEILLVSDYGVIDGSYEDKGALEMYRHWNWATPISKEGNFLRRQNKVFLEKKALAPEKNRDLTFEQVQRQIQLFFEVQINKY